MHAFTRPAASHGEPGSLYKRSHRTLASCIWSSGTYSWAKSRSYLLERSSDPPPSPRKAAEKKKLPQLACSSSSRYHSSCDHESKHSLWGGGAFVKPKPPSSNRLFFLTVMETQLLMCLVGCQKCRITSEQLSWVAPPRKSLMTMMKLTDWG